MTRTYEEFLIEDYLDKSLSEYLFLKKEKVSLIVNARALVVSLIRISLALAFRSRLFRRC